MDPKELKALLKEAKDCLKSKDFPKAQANCKLILKKVPNHYQANLFLGTSLKEQGKFQQAIESYKKAIEVDPVEVYAWQGIILTYEKQGIKNHPDLLDAYKRVATFFETDDKAKYIESTKKLAHVLVSQQDTKGALKVITRLAKSHGVDLEMAGLAIQLLSATKYDTRTPDQNQLYTESLHTTVTESPKPSDDMCKKYFTQLNRAGSFEQVVRHAFGMQDKWNFYCSPMEWLCRYYIEDRLDSTMLAQIGSFELVTDKLFKLHPSSSFGHFARGKYLIDSGTNFSDGFSFLMVGLESSYNFHAVKILIRGRLDYGDFERAVDDCNNALRQFSANENYCKLFRLFLAEALISINIDKAEELLTTIKNGMDDGDGLDQWIILNILLNAKKFNFDSLSNIVNLAEEKGVQHLIVDFYRVVSSVEDKTNSEDMKNTIDRHLETIPPKSGNEEKFSVYVRLEAAILLFNLSFYKESADLLFNLTAMKYGRILPLAWKYLGKLYSLQNDVELASKCYKKAYKLSPTVEVGALLSDTYFSLGKEDINQELLVEATKAFVKSKSKWAWLRLGVLYLNNGDANSAVTALQAAIRSDITDSYVWESLGDAYFLRGSYSAALNTYNKALELDPNSMYAKLKVGVVYQCLGHHDKSIETLKNVLNDFPENPTPILVELARTSSMIAQELSVENFDVRAQMATEDSVAYAVLAILQSPRRILLPWKIIGESSLTLNNLTDDYLVKVPTFLLGENPQSLDPSKVKSVEDFEYKRVSLDKLREIGIQALLECLRVMEEPDEDVTFSVNLRAYVYHQLGLLYFHRARRSQDTKMSSEMYKKAMIAAKKAVASNQTQYIFWNSLGVISYFVGNDELAQHAFIKSLEIEGSNVVAWCNLGMLYLKHDNPMLAHQIFYKAQSASPLHATSWIGQGLFAESIEHIEAPDLFRHAAHLDPSAFAVSCYADWVCRILLKEVNLSPTDFWFSITRVDALTTVNDLITKVEARNRTPQLYNMKGIIAALNSFYTTALESFDTALELATSNSAFSMTEENVQQILVNKIVILVKLEMFNEAVDAFSSIENLDIVGYAVGALTMIKLGYLDQSEKLYEQLLATLPESSSHDGDRINATIGLGLVHNLHFGPEAACNLLLQDFMVKSPHGLLALAAIGIMNGDSEFVSNVMPHLEEFKDEESVLPDIGLLKACFHIMNGNSKRGVDVLLKLIHNNPLNVRLWTFLSQIVFRHELQTIQSFTILRTTMTALKLSSLVPKGVVDRVHFTSSAMVSLCHVMNDDSKTAITSALNGIRKFPKERENWIVLACAFWYKYVETRNIESYKIVVNILEKELTLNRINKRAVDWSQAFLKHVKSHCPS